MHHSSWVSRRRSRRTYVLGIVTLVLLSVPSVAKDERTPVTFPQSWSGHWAGPCTAWRPGKPPQSFRMELRIAPIEGSKRWTWEIVYEGEKRQVRPYELVPVDPAKGHYLVDEKNSILLDTFVVNDIVCSRFWVGEARIDAQYELRGDEVLVTLVTHGAQPSRISGGEGRVPSVASYSLRAVQRAALRRLSKPK